MAQNQPGNMYDYYKKTQLAVRHGSMRLGAHLLRRSKLTQATNNSSYFVSRLGENNSTNNGVNNKGVNRGANGKSAGRAPASSTPLPLDHCRVLFLRQNQIGDALISTPIFHALRQHFPNITLDVLLNRRNAAVYDSDTNIRRTYVIKRRPLDIITTIRLIRAARYDFVVDLVQSKSSTSTLICLLSNAKLTVGPERDNDFAYDIVIPRALQSSERMLKRTAACLSVFNIDPNNEPLHAYYNLLPETEAFAEDLRDRVLQTNDVGDAPERRLIGINISGSKDEKYLGTEKFIECLKTLQQDHPNDVFMLIYSPQYAEQATQIHRHTSAALAGNLPTLNHFAAVISKLDRLITTDSAAVHFADIFGVPLVSLSIDPESNTLWNPSYTEFETVRSKQGSLSSVTPAEVIAAWRRLERQLR